MPRTDAVIIDAIRTPIGKYGGILRDIRPDDLSAHVLKGILERTGMAPTQVQDVMWGCANQAGEDNRNVGRMGLLLAGMPHSVPGTTINRLCGSSLDAVNMAARAIWSDDLEIVIAGGVESMSRAPYSIAKNPSGAYGNIIAYDTALGWRYPNPQMLDMFPLESMGETTENIAEKYGIGRTEQDEFALGSHEKAAAARIAGNFKREIIPVPVPQKQGNPVLVSDDEGPRADTSMEKLAKLPPAFRKNGTVTAGNSSSLNDGASAILIMSGARAKQIGLKPVARILATGVAGVDPRHMGIGPVPAVHQALKKAGMTIQDIDIMELNEAFAAQSIAVLRDLGMDRKRINQRGGAIALGHPLGASGARILTTLLHLMADTGARYGVAAMCIGVGQGIATIIEMLK